MVPVDTFNNCFLNFGVNVEFKWAATKILNILEYYTNKVSFPDRA